MTMTTPVYNQQTFAGYADGTESGSTSKGTNTNFTQDVSTIFHIRFLVQETAGGSEVNKTLQLECNYNSLGWGDVNASSSYVQSVATSNITDGADTTQRLGAGTFITPNGAFDEVDGLAGDSNLDYAGNDEVEALYSVQIISADVAHGITLQLRVKGLDTYTNTPTITVNKPTVINCTAATLASAGQSAVVDNGDIFHVASDSAVETSGAASLTIPYPSGLQANDIAICTIQWNGSPGSSPTPPTGWTELAIETGVSNPKSWALYRVCTGSEGANETFSWTNSITSGGIISLYRRADTTTPIDVSATTTQGSTASSTPSLTGVTTVTNRAMVIMGIGPNSSTVTYTPDAPITEREETPTGGKMASHGSAIQATAGATGSLTGTFSASREYSGWVSALRPASNDVTINVTAATLVSAGVASSVTPGAISISCTLDTLLSAGQAATISNVTTVNVTVAPLASAGQAVTIIPGAISVQVTPATLASHGETASITPGAVSIASTVGLLVSGGQTATITPGAVSITGVVTTLVSAGQTATITASGGAQTINAVVAVLVSAGLSNTVVPGAVSISATSAVLVSGGLSASISTGAIIQALAATLVSNGESTTIMPGGVSVTATNGLLTSNGETALIIPGAVSVQANNGLLTSTPYPITLDTPVSIATVAGVINSNGQAASILAGATSVQINIGTLTINGQTVTVVVVAVVTQIDSDNLYTVPARVWLKELDNRDWIYTPATRDWLEELDNRDWIYTPATRDWLDVADD